MNFDNLDSKDVFKWFFEISKIPRESGYEKEISDFLLKFAENRGFEVYQDKENNIIMKKKATKGYENFDAIIIQGHMDMVCEKTKESKHNFRNDPIELIIDNNILKANNTTLGADDGIAIAIGLALFDSKNIPHPNLELLITTSEETGMNGAFAVDHKYLKGKTLINIDSEKEGVFIVSCAGGLNILVDFHIIREINKYKNGLAINIYGLKGGHSGIDIKNQRANAIKILGRILYYIKNNINIVSLNGGTKHNVIAESSYALIVCDDINKSKSMIEDIFKSIKNEYRVEDFDMSIDIYEVDKNDIKEYFIKDLTNNIIDFMMLSPNGVLYMSKDIENLVQTSANNGILKEDNNKLTFTISLRSSMESSLKEITNMIEILANRFNACFKIIDKYPAWEYDLESKVKDIAIKVYKKIMYKEPKIDAIHAGLECGILKKILFDVDMISMGPNIYDAHTPKEHLDIISVDNVWKVLKELIISIK